MARVVIMAVVLEGRSKSEVARDYGLSRRWVQTLIARYEAEGEAAFEPRSRRPLSNPHRTAHDVEAAIVALRKQLAEQGHRVRKDRVDRDGKLTLRHASRLHHIGIGHRWAGTAVLMLIHELNIRVITENTGELVRELILDYQPQRKG